MKKLYFSFMFLLAGLGMNQAQVLLLQSNHAPAIGDMYKTSVCNTVGVAPGSSGTGSMWDMSAVGITTAMTTFSVVSVPTSSASAYPSASVAVQTDTTSAYSFYSSSAANLKYWGGDMQVSTYNMNLNYSSAAVVVTYPCAFNTTNTNTIAGTISVTNPVSVNGTFTGTCSINADGTGTLALPSRTFTNIMRLTTTQNITFSTSFGSGTLTQINYDYYSTLAKTPLFTISTTTIVVPFVGTTSQMIVTVNSDYQYVGINESLKEIVSLNLFPNPVKNHFNISFVNENAEPVAYELINTIGQTVKKESLGSQQGKVNYNINVTDIPAGVYFVKVSSGVKISTKKITIQ